MRKSRLAFPLLLVALLFAGACREPRMSEILLVNNYSPRQYGEMPRVGIATFDFLVKSEKHQGLIREKWENYLRELFRLDFRQELKSEAPPHWEFIRELIEKYRLFASFNFDNSLYLKNHFAGGEPRVFLVGRLAFEEKSTTVVVDAKVDGKKKQVLKNEALWLLKVEAFLISSKDYQVVRRISVEESDKTADTVPADIMLTSMVEKAAQKMLSQFSKRRLPEKRYFLRY